VTNHYRFLYGHLLFFKSFLPTQTYNTFTLKTFKGQFTTKVRTCSLKYLPTHLLKDCKFALFSIKHDVGIEEHSKHNKSLSCTKNNHFVIIYNKNKLLYMPFATKQNKKLKFKGVWKHYDTWHFIDSPHTWVKHCPQWFKKKVFFLLQKIEEKGKEKAHNLLGALWRILEVKVLHHSQEHAVILLVHAITPLDITT